MTAPDTGSFTAHNRPDPADVSDKDLLEFLTKDIRNGKGSLELCLTEAGDIGLYKRGHCVGRGDTVRECILQHLRTH
jgi:hypothetical protein